LTHTLLLGAEGCSEMRDVEWLRDATDEEALAFWKKVREDGMTHTTTIDGMNRPYWVMTLTDEAPEDVVRANEGVYRAVRLHGELPWKAEQHG